MSQRVSIEKERMKAAYDAADKSSNKKEFESYVNKLPAYILTNGLGNTLAYLAGKTEQSWKEVIDAIFNWLNNQYSGFQDKMQNLEGKTNGEKLLNLIKDEKMDDAQMRAFTAEILAYVNWLRKFAKAFRIKIEDDTK